MEKKKKRLALQSAKCKTPRRSVNFPKKTEALWSAKCKTPRRSMKETKNIVGAPERLGRLEKERLPKVLRVFGAPLF